MNTPLFIFMFQIEDVTKGTSPILEYVLGISGWIIAALFGVVVYFYKKSTTSIDNSIEALDKTVKALERTAVTLNAAIEVLKLRFDNQVLGCDLKHQPITEKLENHEKRISDNEEEINNIQIKMAKYHGDDKPVQKHYKKRISKNKKHNE